MPSGTSSSRAIALSRERSAGLAILREIPPPRAGVRHQDAVAAGERQIGGERRALVAALLLDHLDQHDLAALDDLLDLVAAQQPRALPGLLVEVLGRLLVGVGRDRERRVVAAASRGGLVGARRRPRPPRRPAGSGSLQQLPVGLRDLVVVGVDLAERQEAVALAAIVDERRLERGFDPGDLGEVDVSL